MKKIIVMLGMVCMFGGVANAASSSLIGVLESSVTVRVVSIASGTTGVDICAGIEMPDRTSFVIQNINASFDAYCSASLADLTAGHYFIIAAGGGSISLNLRPYSAKNAAPLKIFCRTTATTGSTGVAVIQAY
jgi:hypothetical protein